MLWVKVSTHVIDHARFLEAKAVGRDLWHWGMLYAGAHETDGELPMVAVLASTWGAGGRANAKVAASLVRIGLWERTDTGYRICRWAEQGNVTKAQIQAERDAAKERMAARRSGNVRANVERTSPDVPTSTSTSLSSGSDLSPPDPPPVAISPPPADGPPEWWQGALDTVEMATGVKIESGPAWLRYDGHRDGKGRAPTRKDAQYWLTTVIVREMKQEREEAHRRNERDGERTKALQVARTGPEVKPLPSVTPLIRERAGWERDAATPQQSAEAAANLARLLGGVGR